MKRPKNDDTYSGKKRTAKSRKRPKTISKEASANMNLQLEEQKDINVESAARQKEESCLPLPICFSEAWNTLRGKLVDATYNKSIKGIPDLLSLIKWCIGMNGIKKSGKVNLSGLEGILTSFEPAALNSFLFDTIPFIAFSALQVESLFKPKESLKLLISQAFSFYKQKQHRIQQKSNSLFISALLPVFIGNTESTKKLTVQMLLSSVLRHVRKMKIIEEDKVRYTRLVIPMKEYEKLNANHWLAYKNPMLPIVIKEKGGMESVENGIIVDFANKHLSGGVLRKSAVQEEILFLIMPELLITQFLCEKLADNEAMLIEGLGMYSKYSGYKEKLCYEGNRFGYSVLAMDALHFADERARLIQFQPKPLNKAFVGFGVKDEKRKIATGRWGCGVFKGH
eukprot:TRINITY_DN2302_c0_g2_i3.p1 TRINITY_DN2302_c0_g2~~TRINITY_DN2302_c0_g2_i3.p1  ORF type:complete len:396 (+),score=92.22 TRINITY_DN2302_c0_g2_i3:1006-2193(+)